jgi:outer membrane immunogenic protein
MKKLFVAGIAAAAFCGAPAIAADMPVKAPVYKAAPAPLYDWSGFYIGGHAGYAWARSQEGNDPPIINGLYVGATCAIVGPALTSGTDCEHKLSGFIGGGQAGYNWQTGNWVFGAEASFSGADLSGTETINFGAGPNTFATKIKSLLLATGRLGYAWDRTLLYGKAGYAGGSVRFTETGIPGGDTATTTSWHNGWAVGGGIEYALTPNWILGAEYNFADLGSNRKNAAGSPSGIVTPITVDVDKFQSVLGRLSYKFGSR